jgi:hypothetical protein
MIKEFIKDWKKDKETMKEILFGYVVIILTFGLVLCYLHIMG